MRKGILAVVAGLILSANKAEAQPPNIYTFNQDVKVTDAVPG